MATGESILEKMREYEAKVLTALGFKPEDPVSFDSMSPGEGTVTFAWFGPGDPPPPRNGFYSCRYAAHEPVQYTVHKSALAPGVWDRVMLARTEWETNFLRVTP